MAYRDFLPVLFALFFAGLFFFFIHGNRKLNEQEYTLKQEASRMRRLAKNGEADSD